MLSTKTKATTGLVLHPKPVNVPNANTSAHLNKQEHTEVKTIQVTNLRVGQQFKHDHDKRIYTIVEVTDKK